MQKVPWDGWSSVACPVFSLKRLFPLWPRLIGDEREQELKRISITELEIFGDNIDTEGRFTSYEILYRQMFNRWFLDKGLLQEFVRYYVVSDLSNLSSNSTVVTGGVEDGQKKKLTMIDLGAGGGHYSEFLNNTGLISSVAYDAPVDLLGVLSSAREELDKFTEGKVAFFDVAGKIPPRESGDGNSMVPTSMVPSILPQDVVLCVEVAEHVPQGREMEMFLLNLNFLGKRGMILSWAGHELCGLGWGHVNCLKNDTSVEKLVEEKTDYVFDEETTHRLRQASEISWIKKTVSFFRKKRSKGSMTMTHEEYYRKSQEIERNFESGAAEGHHFDGEGKRGEYIEMILQAPVLPAIQKRPVSTVAASPQASQAHQPVSQGTQQHEQAVLSQQAPLRLFPSSDQTNPAPTPLAPQQQQQRQQPSSKPLQLKPLQLKVKPQPAQQQAQAQQAQGAQQQPQQVRMQTAKSKIETAIFDLDKIQEWYKERRPKDETPPDFLNYEEVLRDLPESWYA